MSAICVIDDDALARIAMEMALQHEGFPVRSFSSAAEFLAAEFMDAGGFDEIGCILTDIEMPGGVTGLDLLAVLAKKASEFPVVVMTGKGEGAFRLAALALGARAYLEKPFSSKRLVEAISDAMRAPAILAAE
jgi:FixJ family two-component response regulator